MKEEGTLHFYLYLSLFLNRTQPTCGTKKMPFLSAVSMGLPRAPPRCGQRPVERRKKKEKEEGKKTHELVRTRILCSQQKINDQ